MIVHATKWYRFFVRHDPDAGWVVCLFGWVFSLQVVRGKRSDQGKPRPPSPPRAAPECGEV